MWISLSNPLFGGPCKQRKCLNVAVAELAMPDEAIRLWIFAKQDYARAH